MGIPTTIKKLSSIAGISLLSLLVSLAPSASAWHSPEKCESACLDTVSECNCGDDSSCNDNSFCPDCVSEFPPAAAVSTAALYDVGKYMVPIVSPLATHSIDRQHDVIFPTPAPPGISAVAIHLSTTILVI